MAAGLARRFENAALFSGLVLVGAAIATCCLAVSGPSPVLAVAVACGLGLAPSFPVTMAALSREMPPKVAQPMIALGSAGRGDGAVARRRHLQPHGVVVERAERAARAAGRARRPARVAGDWTTGDLLVRLCHLDEVETETLWALVVGDGRRLPRLTRRNGVNEDERRPGRAAQSAGRDERAARSRARAASESPCSRSRRPLITTRRPFRPATRPGTVGVVADTPQTT